MDDQMITNNGPLAWMNDALCAEVGPAPFFPKKGESPDDALIICGSCDVRAACLRYALDKELNHGVWGGKLQSQRNRMLRDERRKETA